MTLIDVHSHWGTKRGYPLQTEAELAQQRATWNSEPSYHSEAEMADHFRANGVKAILDFGFAKFRPIEEMQSLHDYAFETERALGDVILGHCPGLIGDDFGRRSIVVTGVVIGADSIATSSAGPQRLIQIASGDKIAIVADRLIIACSGSVGLSQQPFRIRN